MFFRVGGLRVVAFWGFVLGAGVGYRAVQWVVGFGIRLQYLARVHEKLCLCFYVFDPKPEALRDARAASGSSNAGRKISKVTHLSEHMQSPLNLTSCGPEPEI